MEIEAPVQIDDEYVRNYLWEHNLFAIDEGDLRKLMRRVWQGLTDEEIKNAWAQLWYDLNNGKYAASDDPSRHTTVMFARAIEAKLKEKNSG